MESLESADGVIAQLMSLGFELNECQGAIEAGRLSAETAVEWIMNERAKSTVSYSGSSTLHLKLPSNANEGLSVTPQSHQTTQALKICSTGPLPCAKDGQPVVSRSQLSDKQQKQRERFREKEREKLKKEVQRNRLSEATAKERIRLQIEDDRQRMRDRQQMRDRQASQIAHQQQGQHKEHKKVKSSAAECSLQLRLPNGKVVRQQFATGTSLQDVVNKIVSQENITGLVSLFQPFPRREYSSLDMDKSLKDAGLCPTGSLVFRVEEQPTPMDTSNKPDITAESEAGMSSVLDSHHSSPINEGNEDEEPQQNDEDMDDDFNDEPPNHPLPGIVHAPGHHGYHHYVAGHGWGSGHKLGGTRQRDEDEYNKQVEEMDASNAVREAAIKRWTSPHTTDEEVLPASGGDKAHSYQIQSLTDLCVVSVAKRLPGYLVHNPVLSLASVPRAAANRILKVLINDKTLRPKTLHPFLNCRLQKLTLDCYSYATNELLQAIGSHTSLQHLTASGCPLITDQGVATLAELKQLRSLNLSSCQQLSDKSFATIRRFRNLVVLKMDHTKLTDSGIALYATNAPLSLHHISLCGIALTDRGLQALAGIQHLHSLEIEDTQIRSLSPIARMKQLQLLSLAKCSLLSDAHLSDIAGHPSLTGLNLRGCTIGDAGLHYLSTLGLRTLKLPQRHNITDLGIAALSGLPLSSLDLTDFIRVTDVGVKALSKMTSLRDLSLANTRVTDEGLYALSGLISLTSLNMDKTAITSEGGVHISKFHFLQTLSLSHTRVSNKLLKSKALNSCFQMQKLNLSYTRVSDKGIQALYLPMLTHLNLDGTKAILADPSVLSGLPKVWSLRHHQTNEEEHQQSSSSEERDDE